MQDNEKKLREQLWKKASKEFETFKEEQLNESKETIFDNAYKIATLSDFTDMCDPDCGCFSLNEIKTLLKEKYPVHTLYNYYQKTDSGSISDLYEAIWYSLSEDVSRSNMKHHNKKQVKDVR